MKSFARCAYPGCMEIIEYFSGVPLRPRYCRQHMWDMAKRGRYNKPPRELGGIGEDALYITTGGTKDVRQTQFQAD